MAGDHEPVRKWAVPPAVTAADFTRDTRRSMRPWQYSFVKIEHDWTISIWAGKCPERCAQRAKPAKNVSIARLKAEGWWRLAAWPASGITTFIEPEIFAAM